MTTSLSFFRLIKWLMTPCLAVALAVPAYAESDFLKPSEAFQLQFDVAKKAVHWTIADGYYLYESRVKVSLADDKTLAIPFHFLTASEEKDDPNFGRVNVFHQQMAIAIDSALEGTNKLKVTYQGCAEAGLCYPPQTDIISFNTDAALSQKVDSDPIKSVNNITTEAVMINASTDGKKGS